MAKQDLDSLQAWMQQALLQSSADPASIEAHIAPSAHLSASEHLAIYQRSYYARLLAVMKEQFKALCATLGESLFSDFVRAYLADFPSESPTLSELGARFPVYLEQIRPDKAEKEVWVDFMINLAQYEWDLYLMFDAPGHEGKPYATAAIADEALRLQPCFALKKYAFSVNVFYREFAHNTEQDIPAPQKTFLALCRKNYRIGIFRLSPPQFYFLRKMGEGQPVSKALQATADFFKLPLEDLSAAWQRWREDWLDAGFFKNKH